MNKKGFTLIEILVVVLILGILASIVVPIYTKSVEKTRLSEALLVMNTVTKDQQKYYLQNNNYAQEFDNLDTKLIDKDGQKAQNKSYKSKFYNYELTNSGILSQRNNKEYMLYFDYITQQIMCNPSEYFICKDFMGLTEEPCKNANLSWAKSNSTCYSSKQTKCEDLYGTSLWNGEFCGYSDNAGNGKELKDDITCEGTLRNSCANTKISDGGNCVAKAQQACSWAEVEKGGVIDAKAQDGGNWSTYDGGTCNALGGGNFQCARSTYKNGGTCVAEGGASPCHGSTFESGGVCRAEINKACGPTSYPNNNLIFEEGSVCIGNATNSCSGFEAMQATCEANAQGACNNTYTGKGCCKGTFCPLTAPSCSE